MSYRHELVIPTPPPELAAVMAEAEARADAELEATARRTGVPLEELRAARDRLEARVERALIIGEDAG
jgi:hypothetical protein